MNLCRRSLVIFGQKKLWSCLPAILADHVVFSSGKGEGCQLKKKSVRQKVRGNISWFRFLSRELILLPEVPSYLCLFLYCQKKKREKDNS